MKRLDFPRLLVILRLLLLLLLFIQIDNISILLLQPVRSFSVVPTTTTTTTTATSTTSTTIPVMLRINRLQIMSTATKTTSVAREIQRRGSCKVFASTDSTYPTTKEIATTKLTPFFTSRRRQFNYCCYFRRDSFNNHFRTTTVRWMTTNDDIGNEKVVDNVDNNNENKNDNNINNTNENNQKRKQTKKSTRRSSKKFEIVQSKNGVHHQEQEAKLAALFDELAKKDGFDSSMAYYSKDADDNDNDDDDILNDNFDIDRDDVEDDDDDDEYLDFGDPNETFERVTTTSSSDDPNNDSKSTTTSSDFYVTDDAIQSMDDRIKAAQKDMNTGRVTVPKELDDLAISIDLETTTETLRRLGFQPESLSSIHKNRKNINVDGTSRSVKPDTFTLNTDPMVCSACGSDFQSTDERRPGYIPLDKYVIQEQLAKKMMMMKQQQHHQLDGSSWSAEDEVEWLLQSSSRTGTSNTTTSLDTNKDNEVDEDKFDDEDDELDQQQQPQEQQRRIICKRCHTLQNYATVDTLLRPGWTTKEPLLSQENFRNLLRPLRSKTAVIIALIDIFDFSGSVLTELDTIVGPNNPVIIAANKADLLPPSMGQLRIEKWVRTELDYLGIRSIRNIGQHHQQQNRYEDDEDDDNDDNRRSSNSKVYTSQTSVRLISCKTGMGVEAMLNKARKLADELDCDIYVIGSANSGKSTLLNRILNNNKDQYKMVGQQQQPRALIDRNRDEDDDNNDDSNYEYDDDITKIPMIGKIRAGNKNKFKDIITTSPLPGTTLKFLSIDLGSSSSSGDNNNKRRLLYDTPGLLVPGTITQFLTPEELKLVVPRNRVEPITYRIANGKCVLIGGLARIELINDSKPFLFTFYISNSVKLHPTDSSKADEYVAKHTGTLLTPPLLLQKEGDEYQQQQVLHQQLSTIEEHVLTIDGCGWKEAAADITITGLGWIAITGAGTASIKVRTPKNVIVEVRPPLMPFDIWETTAKYTGTRSIKRKGNTSSSGNSSNSNSKSSTSSFSGLNPKITKNANTNNKKQNLKKKKGSSRY